MKKLMYISLASIISLIPSELSAAKFNRDSSVQALTKNLENRDRKKKAHAILGLANLNHTESVDSIRKMLRDKHSVVVKAAVNALVKFVDTDSTDDLYRVFKKSRKKKDVQRTILRAFKTLNDDKTVSFIRKYLGRLDPTTAQVAYITLQEIQEPFVFSSDSGRISLDSFSISGYIGQGKRAKVKIGREFFGIDDTILGYKITAIDPDEGIVSLEKNKELFTKEIDTSGQSDLEKSIEKLNSDEDEVVYKALLDVIYHRSSQASDEVLSLASGKNKPNIKLTAIYALGQCEITESESFLKKLLAKPKSSDQIILAAEALSLIGDENALDILDPLAQHSNPWVRNAIISAIGYMESPNSVGTLVRGLDDKFSFIRNNAYNQLINLASGDTVGTMVSILQGGATRTSPIKNNLIEFLRTIPGGDNLNDPFTGISTKRKVPEIKTWTPSFIIVSIGQFGTKPVLKVIENDKEMNLKVGDFVEDREIIKIDVEDESIIVKDGKNEITLIQGEGDEAPAEIFE